MINPEKVIKNVIPMTDRKYTDYEKSLLKWIFILAINNQNSIDYYILNDISIGVHLLKQELIKDDISKHHIEKVELSIYEYLNNITLNSGIGNLVNKLVLDIEARHPDFIDLIGEISDHSDYAEAVKGLKKETRKIVPLYLTDKISEEDRGNSLIFGDNITDDETTIKDIYNSVSMMTEEFVEEYLDNRLGKITFSISEDSIMYLKDTYGVELATVYTKQGARTIIKYSNENNSKLFLLFEPSQINNYTIYALSLNSKSLGERELLILEKNKSETVNYKFLFGKEA